MNKKFIIAHNSSKKALFMKHKCVCEILDAKNCFRNGPNCRGQPMTLDGLEKAFFELFEGEIVIRAHFRSQASAWDY